MSVTTSEMASCVTKTFYFLISILKINFVNCRAIEDEDLLRAGRGFPRLGNCYRVYDQTEELICEKPADFRKFPCVTLTRGHNYCLTLQTPTNETIELRCKETKEEAINYYEIIKRDTCFKVYSADNAFQKVCVQQYGSKSVGITTPDNFTVLLYYHYCLPFVTIEDIKVYDDFVSNFSFDPEIRSCYKVYKQDQEISPYTCASRDVDNACIQVFPQFRGCIGVLTQNNETVILECPDDSNKKGRRNCFEIYTADNSVHVSCQKKLEERCVGISTPSNLTILFECHFCYERDFMYTSYDTRKQRRPVRPINYLTDEYLGKHSYLEKIAFDVFNQTDVGPSGCDDGNFLPKSHAYWIPNTNCYGLTLESNETIILECTTKPEDDKPGCFNLIGPEGGKNKTCMKILSENCVGITTPKKLAVGLACHFEACNEMKPIPDTPESFRLYNGIYGCYEVYDRNQEINAYTCRKKAQPENYVCVDWIIQDKYCLGLKTPYNETIEIACSAEPASEFAVIDHIENCFDVRNPNGSVERVCQKTFGNNSIGITTPNNNTILFYSPFCTAFKKTETLAKSKEFLKNFSFDPYIRSCYKIYTEDQEVTPYTCLSDEIHESCVRQLYGRNCIGITTQNNETVILHCPDDPRKTNVSGCFEVHSPDGSIHSVCQKKLDETCIGLTTPSNLTVLLECYQCISPDTGEILPPYNDRYRKTFRKYIEDIFYMYKGRNYSFQDGFVYQSYSGYRDTIITDYLQDINGYALHQLLGHNNCLGITVTESLETVILECPNTKIEEPGCFEVYGPQYGADNKIIGPEIKIQTVCLRLLSENCVGIVTPSSWPLPFHCMTKVPDLLGGVTSYIPPNKRRKN